MAWKTLYITGRPGCDQDVLYYMNKHEVDFMTGSHNEQGLYLFWITDNFVLDSFKRSIGSKVIFKNRLRFFFNVESFINFRDHGKPSHGFTPAQEQMFRDFTA